MSENATSELLSAFKDQVGQRPSTDMPAYNIPVETLLEVMEHLKSAKGFDLLMDITAADWNEQRPRFTVFYHLFSSQHYQYIRLACDCPDDEAPSVPSLTPLWPGANWHERETYDMFGITFEGHPDLKRILMWEGYPYYPLRKEFPLAGLDTDLPEEDIAEITGTTVKPAPMMGGPFYSSTGKPMSKMEPRAADQSWEEKSAKP